MLKIKSKLSVMDEDCGNSPNFMLNVKKSIEKWATSLNVGTQETGIFPFQ